MEIWDGINQVKKKLILRRIKTSRKSCSRAEQRAELLIRNPNFIRELRRLNSTRPGLAEVDHPFAQQALKVIDELFVSHLFGFFCDRWDISKEWDGDMASLSKHVTFEPRLLHVPKGTNDFSSYFFLINPENPDCLLIKIDPWTSVADVRSIWNRIEESKLKIFGFSDKEKWSFGEALCWYDLKKQYKMSLGKIALLWTRERAPHIDDINSFRITIREGIKRMKRYIDRLTPPPIVRNKLEITE